MGTLFKLLRNELLSLGMLFFVIVPFVTGMINDERAPAGVQEFAYKTENLITGSLSSGHGFSLPSGLGGHSSGIHISGRPIHIPRS
ncbi:MAG: hypothetical protein NDJ24_05280 [Alphaproteobacteria bacterium]|nr:hypothetical protein [Alphaproteobacteria bacterium]